jgi:hypothetical protein
MSLYQHSKYIANMSRDSKNGRNGHAASPSGGLILGG